MMKQILRRKVAVTGICKPGAKLQQIITPGLRLPKEGVHCEVLVGGTNDLANGEQHSIYKDLESYIKSRSPNTKLIIATLPQRHDLTDNHDIHLETALANAYIEELASRHNIKVLDFNKIQRGSFTRHGMHLRVEGKWQLAKRLVETLSKTDASNPQLRAATPDPQAPPAPAPRNVRPGPSQAAQPYTLPHDTFADALKTTLPSENKHCVSKNTNIFLGNPPIAPIQN